MPNDSNKDKKRKKKNKKKQNEFTISNAVIREGNSSETINVEKAVIILQNIVASDDKNTFSQLVLEKFDLSQRSF